MARLAALTTALAVLAASSAAAASGGTPFFAGFSEDLPKEIGGDAFTRAADLGGSAFRITTLWSPGQTSLASVEAVKLDRAVSARAGQKLVLVVYADAGSKAPQDDAARSTYCGYVRSLLTRYPAIRDVVVWNEPNKSLFWSPQVDAAGTAVAAGRYTALLARCYDVLHAAFPTVNVIGLALSSTGNDNSGSASPGQFIRDVGVAYRASGRSAPLLDTVAHHPYGADASERPWRKHIGSKTIALGDWNKLMYNLHVAFSGTGQRLPGRGAQLWYTEAGSQSAIAADKAAAYTGSENVKTVPDWVGGEPATPAPPESSPAPDLATQTSDAVRLAACQPHVGAYFNFLLADEPRLAGWQSGALWADLTPKASSTAFRQAFAEAAAGAVNCDALKGGRPSDDYLPPGAPPSVTAVAQTDPLRVAVSWAAAADNTGVTSYRIYRNGAHVGTTAGETAWTNASVQPATTYTYVVRALDAAGSLGDASAGSTLTTPSPPPPPPPPFVDGEAPTGPATLGASVAPTSGLVTLSWPAATDNVAVSGYEVLRDGQLLTSTGGTTHSDTSPPAGSRSYAVRAFDAAGNRGVPATAQVVVPDVTPPSAPSQLRSTFVWTSFVSLAWSSSTDVVGVAGYRVYAGSTLVATTSAASANVTGLARRRTYTFTVQAYDAAGNVSVASSPLVVTTR